MKRKYKQNLFLLVMLAALFIALWSIRLLDISELQMLNESIVCESVFREQKLEQEMIDYLQNEEHKGMAVGLYLLESKFGYQKFPMEYTKENFRRIKKRWQKREAFQMYLQMMEAIWEDLRYFPVPVSTTDSEATVSYVESWMTERTYGGKRGHEGTDIMAKKNVPGLYPVISMTDGVVKSKGWLEKGGYRIGILSPCGGYFYYAHLDSYADVDVGDTIEAGDILGFMGDSGYGVEGTAGRFPVHLHLGIYIYPNGEETSVNPYHILQYLENHKLKCSY